MALFKYDNFPKIDRNDLQSSLEKVFRWLESLNEQLGYTFENLTIDDNFNQVETKNFFETLGANIIISNEIITTNIVSNSLYAEYGDVAQLTVDWLTTSKKIEKYLSSDASIDNYIEINAQGIKFISASVQMHGSVAQTEQAKDRTGNLLYWEKDITYANVTKGYPVVNGKQVFLTANVTDYIAYVYKYIAIVKRNISFAGNDVLDTQLTALETNLKAYTDSSVNALDVHAIPVPTYLVSNNTLSISTSISNAIIRYTTDGTDVGANSSIYSNAIELISGGNMIKAFAQLSNKTSEQITINVTI